MDIIGSLIITGAIVYTVIAIISIKHFMTSLSSPQILSTMDAQAKEIHIKFLNKLTNPRTCIPIVLKMFFLFPIIEIKHSWEKGNKK